MNIIEQSARLVYPIKGGGKTLLKLIEIAGRNCYNSFDKITENSEGQFITGLIKRGHESPIEFADLVFEFVTSRAVLAEITRHRLASFAVTSQRYIAEKDEIDFVRPEWKIKDEKNFTDVAKYSKKAEEWVAAMKQAEDSYHEILDITHSAQEAREVLPNSTACRIYMKANLREWRNIFKLRCDKAAYPQIRALMLDALKLAHEEVPFVFDDLYERFFGEEAAS